MFPLDHSEIEATKSEKWYISKYMFGTNLIRKHAIVADYRWSYTMQLFIEPVFFPAIGITLDELVYRCNTQSHSVGFCLNGTMKPRGADILLSQYKALAYC